MERSIIVRLKAGVLPVALETGRFKNIPIKERTYKVCETNVTEDEYHFLFKCKKLKPERKVMFREVKEICDIAHTNCGEKLKIMLSPEYVKTTARHILNMFEKRRTIMYQNV